MAKTKAHDGIAQTRGPGRAQLAPAMQQEPFQLTPGGGSVGPFELARQQLIEKRPAYSRAPRPAVAIEHNSIVYGTVIK
jgi:hypothetical protein